MAVLQKPLHQQAGGRGTSQLQSAGPLLLFNKLFISKCPNLSLVSIHIFLQDGVAVVTFDTPNSKVNSLNKEVMAEMGEVEPENIL